MLLSHIHVSNINVRYKYFIKMKIKTKVNSLLVLMFKYCHCRNPLYVGIIFIGYLILKALWVQLDIAGEFSHGVVSIKLFFFGFLFISKHA